MLPQLTHIELFTRRVPYRQPFRFGDVTVNEAPQLFVRCRAKGRNGAQAHGSAAEMMVPKWFDKSPDRSNDDNIEDLATSVRLAAARYLGHGPMTPFGHFISAYDDHLEAAAGLGLNRLVAGYGLAVLDKAVIDVACKLEGVSFFDAVRGNLLGVHTRHAELVDLSGFDLEGFLSDLSPGEGVAVRHTVGFVDPVEDDDRRNRGVGEAPVSLRQVISRDGVHYFKIKLSGAVDADIDRLARVARCLDRQCPAGYHVSLDGNEQYASMNDIADLLERLNRAQNFSTFCQALLFVEQPLARADTFTGPIPDNVTVPVIIDEADDTLAAFPRALGVGYRGVSAKSCKGIYKALLNAARCAKSDGAAFISGEDLTLQAGLGLQQDVALNRILGLRHCERNGHFFTAGFAGAPKQEAEIFLAAHPDLYERGNGGVRLAIKQGQLRAASLDGPGFAHSAEPLWGSMTPLADNGYVNQQAGTIS